MFILQPATTSHFILYVFFTGGLKLCEVLKLLNKVEPQVEQRVGIVFSSLLWQQLDSVQIRWKGFLHRVYDELHNSTRLIPEIRLLMRGTRFLELFRTTSTNS
jgi:hypothetical protein